jgi:hypothetical protein
MRHRFQVRAGLLGLGSAVVATGLVALAGPAQAAAVNYHGPYYESSGQAHKNWIYSTNASGFDNGKNFMLSNAASYAGRKLEVCDESSDGIAVYMRVYWTAGGSTDYEWDTTKSNGYASCHTFATVTKSIHHYRMLMNGVLSDPVTAPAA